MSGSFTMQLLVVAFLFTSAFSLSQEEKGKNDQTELRGGRVSADHSFEQKNSRSILEFGLMIICGTGRNPLSYNGYGCYCGIGGKGEPVDDTDRCCKAHDECYTAVKDSGDCPFSWSVYAMPYSRDGCTGCKPKSYYWLYGKCRSALCRCDSVAVECFKRSRFNELYKGHPQSKC